MIRSFAICLMHGYTTTTNHIFRTRSTFLHATMEHTLVVSNQICERNASARLLRLLWFMWAVGFSPCARRPSLLGSPSRNQDGTVDIQHFWEPMRARRSKPTKLQGSRTSVRPQGSQCLLILVWPLLCASPRTYRASCSCTQPRTPGGTPAGKVQELVLARSSKSTRPTWMMH